jgi:RNA polymerase sigma-70 factor (ECF subfamily)
LVELYREVYPRVLRYLRAMQPQDAEDLASDTWIDLASGLARFRGHQGDLRAFAFTIARRRLLDLRRRHARQRTTTVEIERLEALGNVGNIEDEALASLETGWAVALVASALPPAQAEVVLLRVLGDLSVDEVAKVVGKRPGNVRVMHTARSDDWRGFSSGRV